MLNKPTNRQWAYDIIKRKEKGERVDPWPLQLAWNVVHLDQQQYAEPLTKQETA